MPPDIERIKEWHRAEIDLASDQLESCPYESRRWWRAIRAAHQSSLHFILTGKSDDEPDLVDTLVGGEPVQGK